MSVYCHPDFDKHELVAFKHDEASGLKAIVAVHNSNLGPATGGCRMFSYADEHAALADVLRLSRGMTYKSAMAGIPLGGGKAVIIGDPAKEKSRELLLAMGDFIDSLGGRYITAEDSGTGVADMAIIGERTRHVSGMVAGEKHGGDPSPTTAYGVYQGIRASVSFRFNADLKGIRVAMQGIGNVGYHLAKYLVNAGAIVFAADISAQNIDRAVSELGVKPLSLADILSADVDVLAPCALGGAINETSIDDIKATIIAGAANNQLATIEMDAGLMNRGILYAPDYVINAGGIIDVYYQTQNQRNKEMLQDHVDHIGNCLTEIFERSAVADKPTGAIADQMAEGIFHGPKGVKRAA